MTRSSEDLSSPPVAENLRRLVEAESLAFVGASNNPGKWGHMILRNVVDGDYRGRVYPVNPRESEILSLKAWPSVAALPEVPELAIVCVPAAAAAGALEEIGSAGIRSVVVITSGFAEVGNREGEEELARIAAKWGLALVGPNCMGVFSARTNLHATMSGSRPQHGGVSVASQSGNVATQAMMSGGQSGVGFSSVFSIGNSAVLDSAEYLEFFASDEATTAVALYVEGVRDGVAFADALEAAARRKPVVLTKGGRSEPGFRAASSHSAALATPMGLFAGVVKQAGGLLTTTVDDMMDAALALEVAPLPKGNRVAILTAGGGWGVLASDACAAAGLELPALSEQTITAIDQLLPPYWSKGNPVDLVAGLRPEADVKVLEMLAEAPEFDMVLVLGLLWGPGPDPEAADDANRGRRRRGGVNIADRMAELVERTGKPLVGVGSSAANVRLSDPSSRLPVYVTPERAVRALAALVARARFLERASAARRDVAVDAAKAASILDAQPDGAVLSERASLELLASYAIPTVPFELADSARAGVEAAERIGFPVVLKATGAGIAHKTERGLVAVGVRSAAELEEAWESITSRLGTDDDVEGLLVQAMLPSRRELAMGVVRDPVFGPCVLFGSGGVYAEALKDVAFRRAGLTDADALEMIDEVRASALLPSLRGEPAVDRGALADVLVRLGRLALDFPRIAEIDVNPVLVPGGRPTAADALVVLGRDDRV